MKYSGIGFEYTKPKNEIKNEKTKQNSGRLIINMNTNVCNARNSRKFMLKINKKNEERNETR